MKLKNCIKAILILVVLSACNNINEQEQEQARLDSIAKADSIAIVLKQQRVIDSVNTVMREQQIIADSILNLNAVQ